MSDPANYDLGVRFGEEANGTCDTELAIFDRLEMDEGLMNNASFCNGLDATAMCCEQCGWWWEAFEVDDGACPDCRPNEDDG